MSCTEEVENLSTSFENLGRPPTTGITKLGRSYSVKDLTIRCEIVGPFTLGTLRRTRSFSSLKTLPTAEPASTGNNKAESKLVTPRIPQVRSGVLRPLLRPYVPHTPVYSFHNVAIDESPPELCSKCCLEHLPDQACPVIDCTICYKTHRNWTCPYERILPQGTDYNRVKFQAVCTLDHDGQFDEKKWACTWCHGKVAKVGRKFCGICMRSTNHCSYECPKDALQAARFKALRDYDLAFPYPRRLLGRKSIVKETFELTFVDGMHKNNSFLDIHTMQC